MANGHHYYQKVPSVNVCRLNISKAHKLSYTAKRVIKDPGHVLHRPIRKRYQKVVNGKYDRLDEGLWITCTSNTMPGSKVVRTWATRKMRSAIVEELNNSGFDQKGRRLNKIAEFEQGNNAIEALPELLAGTLNIEVMSPIRETKFEEVKRQVAEIVKEVIKICGQSWRPFGVEIPLLQSRKR